MYDVALMLLEGEVNGGERMEEDIELHRPSCTSSGEKGSAPSSGGKRTRLKESPSGKKKRIQQSSLAMFQFSDFNTSLIDLVRSSLDSSSSQPRLPSAEELELELREKRARAEALEIQNQAQKQMLDMQRLQMEQQQQNTTVLMTLLNQLNNKQN